MASKYWIKLYHEILNDPKMGRLSDRLFRRSIELFLIAGEYDQDGFLPSLDDIAYRLRISDEDLQKDLADLEAVNIITWTDEGWIVTKFKDRQEALTSTERWRKWQERQKMEKYYPNEEPTDVQRESNETLVDIDKNRLDKNRLRKEEEEEAEEKPDNGDFSTIPAYRELEQVFVQETKLPILSGGPKKWFENLEKLVKADITPDILRETIREMYDKDFAIVGMQSLVNPAMITRGKRNHRPKGPVRGSDSEDALLKYAAWEDPP